MYVLYRVHKRCGIRDDGNDGKSSKLLCNPQLFECWLEAFYKDLDIHRSDQPMSKIEPNL